MKGSHSDDLQAVKRTALGIILLKVLKSKLSLIVYDVCITIL